MSACRVKGIHVIPNRKSTDTRPFRWTLGLTATRLDYDYVPKVHLLKFELIWVSY
jgi:hypothetical protein